MYCENINAIENNVRMKSRTFQIKMNAICLTLVQFPNNQNISIEIIEQVNFQCNFAPVESALTIRIKFDTTNPQIM